MNKNILTLALAAALAAIPAVADEAAERDKLIAIDKAWGETTEAAKLETFLDPRLMAISPQGLADRAQMMAEETGPNVPMGPYQPGHYKVMFLDADLAVMVHDTAGEDPHWSMHVWQKMGDHWQVVATSSTPIAP